MSCRPAPACATALREATSLHPDRSRASDGICASQQHSEQNPDSDHEPDEEGLATAFDITHDPDNGCDVDVLAARLVARRDPRVKYLIRNGRICRSYPAHGIPAWAWVTYSGANPHKKHMHVSVLQAWKRSTLDWWEDDDMFTPEDRALLDERLDAIEVKLDKALDALAGWQPGRKIRSLLGRIGDKAKATR